MNNKIFKTWLLNDIVKQLLENRKLLLHYPKHWYKRQPELLTQILCDMWEYIAFLIICKKINEKEAKSLLIKEFYGMRKFMDGNYCYAYFRMLNERWAK